MKTIKIPTTKAELARLPDSEADKIFKWAAKGKRSYLWILAFFASLALNAMFIFGGCVPPDAAAAPPTPELEAPAAPVLEDAGTWYCGTRLAGAEDDALGDADCGDLADPEIEWARRYAAADRNCSPPDKGWWIKTRCDGGGGI